MKLHQIWIVLLTVIGVALIFTLFNFSTTSEEDKQAAEETLGKKHNYHVYAPSIPDKFDFAGEAVPLNNFTVFERFDKELLKNTYFHSSTILYFKRAHRFFPVIEPILKKHQIPDDFKYLAIIESGLQNVVSPAGAAGYWQFMKTTARSYGLEVSTEVDERYHIIKSTEAACAYLNDAYKKFGSWTLVAASYNMGMGGLSKRLSDQNAKSYYDLVLNQETSRYVYRILAIKRIFQEPKMHGFSLSKRDLYPAWDVMEVKIDTAVVSWNSFAQKNKVSYRVFKDLNPWLRKGYLKNPYSKSYTVYLPNESMMDYIHERSKRSDKIGVFGDIEE